MWDIGKYVLCWPQKIARLLLGQISNWIFRKILDSLMLTKVCMGSTSVSQEQNMVLYRKKLSFMWNELCSHSHWFQGIMTERFQFQWRNPDWRWRKCFSRAFSHGPVYFVLCVCVCVRARRQEMANAGAIRDFRSELQMHSVCSLDWLGLDVLEACN